MCRAPSGQSEEEEEREQKSRYEGSSFEAGGHSGGGDRKQGGDIKCEQERTGHRGLL